VSSYWRGGEDVRVDFVPDAPANWLTDAKRADPRKAVRRLVEQSLPARLAETLCDRLGLDGPIGGLGDRALAAAEAQLRGWRFTPNGSEGYAKAEVTIGGISTAELSSQTMAAKRVPGLFVIGEAVDVTGWLGGYNFQWAWASGVAAGEAV
jgi:predicted Rossmann fold flavoprotein